MLTPTHCVRCLKSCPNLEALRIFPGFSRLGTHRSVFPCGSPPALREKRLFPPVIRAYPSPFYGRYPDISAFHSGTSLLFFCDLCAQFLDTFCRMLISRPADSPFSLKTDASGRLRHSPLQIRPADKQISDTLKNSPSDDILIGIFIMSEKGQKR